MKIIFILILLYSCATIAQPQLPQPDMQIIFPDQAAIVNGQFINSKRGLVIRHADGVFSTGVIDLESIVDFFIPANVSVTGFTVINRGGNFLGEVSYLMSFSSAVGAYKRGDVIECESSECQLYDRPGSNLSITSLDFDYDTSDLYYSFETGFANNGEYIDPLKVYRGGDFMVMFNADGFGAESNNSISAFDSSIGNYSFSATSMFDSDLGLIKPAEVYSSFYQNDNLFTFELSNKVSAVNAYFSADVGWAEFNESVININEGAGSVTIAVSRSGGGEYQLSPIIRSNDGTAVSGIDYEGLITQFFAINENEEERLLSIDIIDNNVVDGNRSFTVDLFEANFNSFYLSTVNPNKNILTINIIDDDGDLIFANGFE